MFSDPYSFLLSMVLLFDLSVLECCQLTLESSSQRTSLHLFRRLRSYLSYSRIRKALHRSWRVGILPSIFVTLESTPIGCEQQCVFFLDFDVEDHGYFKHYFHDVLRLLSFILSHNALFLGDPGC